MSEAQSAASPNLLVVEDERVRAIGSLTRADADQWLMAAFDGKPQNGVAIGSA
jgi:hypothetical protein